MIVVTTESVPGREISSVLGMVQGTSVRAGHFGTDIDGFMQNLVGGEVEKYTKLFAEVREQSLDRMREEARARGADAVVAVRFASTEIAAGAAELLCYGTAVTLVPERRPTAAPVPAPPAST